MQGVTVVGGSVRPEKVRVGLPLEGDAMAQFPFDVCRMSDSRDALRWYTPVSVLITDQ